MGERLYLLNKKGIAGLARISLQPPSWAYETPALPLQTHIMRWNGTPVVGCRGGYRFVDCGSRERQVKITGCNPHRFCFITC